MTTSNSERIEAIIRKLLSSNRLKESEILGCTSVEIEEIKRGQGISRLPESYEMFLSKCGKSMGVFSGELELEFENLLDYKDYFIERASQDWPELIVPNDAFIFSDHLGYAFTTFDTADDAESSIILYVMGEENYVSNEGSFLDWLEDRVSRIS